MGFLLCGDTIRIFLILYNGILSVLEFFSSIDRIGGPAQRKYYCRVMGLIMTPSNRKKGWKKGEKEKENKKALGPAQSP